MPKSVNEGFLRCACPDKRWGRTPGVKGTPEEEELLKAHGFQFARSADGAEYYFGSQSRLVWFNYVGSWSSDPSPSRPDMTLEEYLKDAGHLASA